MTFIQYPSGWFHQYVTFHSVRVKQRLSAESQFTSYISYQSMSYEMGVKKPESDKEQNLSVTII